MDSAVFFTDDSEIMLPKINRRKQTTGRGTGIHNNETILDTLRRSSLPIPGENIELEEEYRNVLREYIRLPHLMFAGLFVEVLLFYKELDKVVPTQLFVVSGRYGLTQQSEEIIPYSAPMKTIDDLTRLDERTEFSKRMQSVSRKKRFIIMSFPLHYYMFFLERNWFASIEDDQLLFTVGASGIKEPLSSLPGFKWIQRRGVTRIGKKNQVEIMDMITSAME